MKTIQLGSGSECHLLPDERLKTIHLTLLFQVPLTREAATNGTLLALYLNRGTGRYPRQQLLERALESAYGATASVRSTTVGRREVLLVGMSCLADTVLPPGEGVLDQAMAVMRDLILNPRRRNGVFDSDQLEQARTVHFHRLASLMNNKDIYAHLRCLELMAHENEPLGIHPLGDPELLAGITSESLWEAYLQFLTRARIDVFVQGNIGEDRAVDMIGSLMSGLDRDRPFELFTGLANELGRLEARSIEETMDVQQGKLNMGYRLPLEFTPAALAAHTLLMSVLGRGPHSRLFRRVREEESLCYDIGAHPDILNGIFLIKAGIDFGARDRVVELIDEILTDIQQRGPEHGELETARALTLTDLLGIRDSPEMMIGYVLRNIVAGRFIPIEQMIRAVAGTTAEQVRELARKCRRELIYFLKGADS